MKLVFFLSVFKRTPFALRKDPFWRAKGLLLKKPRCNAKLQLYFDIRMAVQQIISNAPNGRLLSGLLRLQIQHSCAAC